MNRIYLFIEIFHFLWYDCSLSSLLLLFLHVKFQVGLFIHSLLYFTDCLTISMEMGNKYFQSLSLWKYTHFMQTCNLSSLLRNIYCIVYKAIWEDFYVYVSEKRKKSGLGYQYYAGFGFYRYHTTPVVWDNARLWCHREGAYLVIINSEEELDLLKAIVRRVPKKFIRGKYKNFSVYTGKPSYDSKYILHITTNILPYNSSTLSSNHSLGTVVAREFLTMNYIMPIIIFIRITIQ